MKKIFKLLFSLLLVFSLFGCVKRPENRFIACYEITAPEGAVTDQENAILFIDKDEREDSPGDIYFDEVEMKGNFPLNNYLIKPGIHDVLYCLHSGPKVWMKIKVEAGKYYFLNCNAPENDYLYLRSAEKPIVIDHGEAKAGE